MSWINSSALAQVIDGAMLSADMNLHREADRQLRQWRQEALNFGDCCAELMSIPFQQQQQQQNQQQHQQHHTLNVALAASLMLMEITSPTKWLEAQCFSDKPHVAASLYNIAFLASSVDPADPTLQLQHQQQRATRQFGSPPRGATSFSSSTARGKIIRNALRAFAGIAVAEFPNDVWTRFVYGAAAQPPETPPAPPTSAASSPNSSGGGGSGEMSQGQHQQQQQQQGSGSGSENQDKTADAIPLCRRIIWTYNVVQHLACSTPAMPTIGNNESEERIALRVALLDFTQQLLRNIAAAAAAASNATMVVSNTFEKIENTSWEIARLLLLQIPATHRERFPVVRGFIGEACSRIFEHSLHATWHSPELAERAANQLLIMRASTNWDIVPTLGQLLARSVGAVPPESDIPQDRMLPGSLWRPACVVLLSFLERDAERFCSGGVSLQLWIEIMARILVVAPSSEEVFTRVRHPALVAAVEEQGNNNADNDDNEEKVRNMPLEEVQYQQQQRVDDESAARASFGPGSDNPQFWFTGATSQEMGSRIAHSFEDEAEYLALREQALLSDIKEIDSGITGTASASVSQAAVSIVELLFEEAPSESANAVGRIVAHLFSNDANNNSSTDPTVVAHGCATLLLAAFRVFHVCGSSSFSRAVCAEDAQFLFSRIMDVVAFLFNQSCTGQNNNRNSLGACKDAAHAAARLVIVCSVLCEDGSGGSASNGAEVTQRFVDSCVAVLTGQGSSLPVCDPSRAPLDGSNFIAINSACMFAVSRICARSPAQRQRAVALVEHPPQVPLFAVAAMSMSNNNNNSADDGSLSQQFTLACISELVVCVLELSPPAALAVLWNSAAFFELLGMLLSKLTRASLHVEGPLSDAMRRILRSLNAGHYDYNSKNVCPQYQSIMSPLVNALMTASSSSQQRNNNNNNNNNNHLDTPAGRVLAEILREVLQMSGSLTCPCVRSMYHSVFCQATAIAIADAHARPRDATVRFAASCAATICATFSCFDPNNAAVVVEARQVVANTVLVPLVSLYSAIMGRGCSTILLSRTLSIWGFAASFCLRRLALLGHEGCSSPDNLCGLANNVMIAVCQFLRVTTKDVDLLGIGYFLTTIGLISIEALTAALGQLAPRDRSLIWSTWTTVMCTAGAREFGPTMQGVWTRWRQEDGSNNPSSPVLVDNSAPIFVLLSTGRRKSNKMSKHSIVANDFGQLGERCENPLAAIQLVQHTREAAGQQRQSASEQLFAEDCFKVLF